MKKTLPILVTLLLLLSPSDHAQRRRKPVKKVEVSGRPGISPCGIFYAWWDEFFDDIRDEWHLIGKTANLTYYYNTHEELCDKDTGIMKAWVKAIPNGEGNENYSYSLTQYQIKCPRHQMRIVAIHDYDTNGNVIDSAVDDERDFRDVIPESMGEGILDTVCRYRK
jgi:Surface-adhesin protein E